MYYRAIILYLIKGTLKFPLFLKGQNSEQMSLFCSTSMRYLFPKLHHFIQKITPTKEGTHSTFPQQNER